MKTLLVLVGLQGSGKTTALELIKLATVLRPSTSRAKRPTETDEYHFENGWDDKNLAWSIDRGQTKYGLRKSEIARIENIGMTVFDPANIDILSKVKFDLGVEVITVGLDTIETLSAQHLRVGGDVARQISTDADFKAQRKNVLDCDVVLHGDVQEIQEGLRATIKTVSGRGGFLDQSVIVGLITAGALLKDASVSSVKAASYDLQISDVYWCQGKYITLDASNPHLIIPPYSFVLVQAREEANLPRFVAGSFDLKVSMFVNGVILSNGPQIDPGYAGSLFCMLYNASDIPFPLSRGTSFATLQFNTTSYVSSGYLGKYKNKTSFADFVQANTATGPGGKINERMQDIDTRTKTAVLDLRTELKQEYKEFRNNFVMVVAAVAAIVVAIILVPVTYAFNSAEHASAATDKANEATEKANSAAESASAAATSAKAQIAMLTTATQNPGGSGHKEKDLTGKKTNDFSRKPSEDGR